MQKLQKELVEKILLIPTENSSEVNGKEEVDIINKLENNINDIIIVSNKWCTILDCVIVADSQGNNPRLSERPRVNNRILKELENTIRRIGGKTSEELGLMQSISCSRSGSNTNPTIERMAQAADDRLRSVRYKIIKRTACGLCVFALSAGSYYLIYESRHDNRTSVSTTMGVIGTIGLVVSAVLGVVIPISIRCKKARTYTNLENVTVEYIAGERQSTLD